MSVVKGNEWTFNQVAEMYDKWRPAYVPELYEDIFAYKSIDKASHVLEIGIGTGQATLPFLNTGCHLTAVELGIVWQRSRVKNFTNTLSLRSRLCLFRTIAVPTIPLT